MKRATFMSRLSEFWQREPQVNYWLGGGLFFAVLLFAFDYVPMMDYPDFLYQGATLHRYSTAGDTLDGFMIPLGYPTPNMASGVLIALLSVMLPYTLAGKVFLWGMSMALFGGMTAVLAHHLPDKRMLPAWAAFGMIFTLTANYWYGFLNFNMSFGLACIFYVWIRSGRSAEVLVWRTSVGLLLCYLSHFVGFLLLGAFLTAALISEHNAPLFRSMLVGSIAPIALLVWYIVAKDIPAVRPIELGIVESFLDRLLVTAGALFPFVRIKYVVEPSLSMKAVNMLFLALLGAAFALHFISERGQLRERGDLLLVILLVSIALFTPTRFHGFEHIGGRLAVPIALWIVIAYFRREPPAWVQSSLLPVSIALAGLSMGYYLLAASQFNTMAKEYLPPPTALQELHEVKKGGAEPFGRLLYYRAIEERKPLPFLAHSIFTYRNADPADPSPQRFLDSIKTNHGTWWESQGYQLHLDFGGGK